MRKIYNPPNHRLEFYQQEANADFWDSHWSSPRQGEEKEFAKQVVCLKDSLMNHLVDKYAPHKQSRIIEAGCGNGHFVYFLNHLGYTNTYGIDFAVKTVALINRFFPHLKISRQDIRKTNFPDQTFDFYLSFGVIEHFYEGYDAIIKEAQRITKASGYLAISFPQMSLLRKWKSRFGFYRRKLSATQKDFYQFALDPKMVATDLKDRYHLSLKEIIYYDAIKGLKDEIAPLRPFLRKLYNYRGPSRFWRKLRSRLDRLAKPWASHMAMLIVQNE